MLKDDDPVRVTVAGARSPSWIGTLGGIGAGVKVAVRDALRDSWGALRGSPQAVGHGGAWRCERCRQTTYFWLDRRDPDSPVRCAICTPPPPPPPRRPARERAGTHNGG